MKRNHSKWPSWALFLVLSTTYAALGAYFASQNFIFGDGLSRVVSALIATLGRDPHLGAIGFVWNPLPTLLALPFAALTPLFPWMSSHGLAGILVSALCGAAGVCVIRWHVREFGVGPLTGWFLTLCAAIHPLYVIYSANGSSDVVFSLCVLLVGYGLIRWAKTDDSRYLLLVGLSLGFAYATRYEAVAVAAGVAGVMTLSALKRPREQRWSSLLTDLALAMLPFLGAFVGWALVSKLIVGNWFETFASQYGNSAQVRASLTVIHEATGSDLSSQMGYLAEQSLTLSAVAPVVAILAAVLLVWRRERPLEAASLLPMAASFASTYALFLLGSSFGWLRFQLLLIPLTTLAVAYVISCLRGKWRHLGTVALALGLVASLVVTWFGLRNQRIAREENLLFNPSSREDFARARVIAQDLDSLVGSGQVLTDLALAFPIVGAAKKRENFITTPDRDFPAHLKDLCGTRTRFALVSMNGGKGLDAIQTKYAGAFDGSIGDVEREWLDADGDPTWRLIRIKCD